jgi:hypothetical protein
LLFIPLVCREKNRLQDSRRQAVIEQKRKQKRGNGYIIFAFSHKA